MRRAAALELATLYAKRAKIESSSHACILQSRRLKRLVK